MFASHHWPRWGNERIQEVLRGQRDLYAHMNNQVLHLANQGVTINEIHNVYRVPEGFAEQMVLPRLSRLAATQQPRASCNAILASGIVTRRPSFRCRRATLRRSMLR